VQFKVQKSLPKV